MSERVEMRKIDDDLKSLSDSQLKQEVMKLRRAIRLELRYTGNRWCWKNLASALPEGGTICPLDISEEDFLKYCARYYRRNQKLPIKAKLIRVAEEIKKNQEQLEQYKKVGRLRDLTFTI